MKWIFTVACFFSLQLFAEEVVFKKMKVRVAGKTLVVEVADTDKRRGRGLMFREKLAPGTGMIFIFERQQPLAFWMKNTYIPLSIGYFDDDKKLVDIKKMNPPESLMVQQHKSYPSAKPARYALEVEQGWFEKNNVKLGTKIEFLPSQ